MQTVTVSRDIGVPPNVVRKRMADTEPFMAAGGFAEVDVTDDGIHLKNTVGLFVLLELHLVPVEREGAEFAYEQVDGIFREMETIYKVDPTADGKRTTVAATTCFELDLDYAGPLLDASIVSRKRRLELSRQLDYLAVE